MTIQDVFIVMPFTEQTIVTSEGRRTYSEAHFNDVYETLCSAVREYNTDIHVDRMEQKHGNIVNAIIRRLHTADVVIAVLAGKNANVFYELGIRHSLRRNTMMLVEDRDEYPFDLSGYYSEEFSVDHLTDQAALKDVVKQRLSEYEREPLPDSPVLEVLNQAEFEQLRALNAWETRRAAIVLHGLLGETAAFFNIVNACDDLWKDMLEMDPKDRPRMNLVWDMIEGFRQNRPMPGLPTSAYLDAESIYRVWREMEDLWNDAITSEEPHALDDNSAVEIFTRPVYMTSAYIYDLTTAADYVTRFKTTFKIPWPGSLAVAAEYDQMDRLDELIDTVIARANPVIEHLEEFDRTFTGVPPDASVKTPDAPSTSADDYDDVLRSFGATREATQ